MPLLNAFVTLSLTSVIKGNAIVPSASGLNWGQRPKRNENQAYLAIPAYIQKSNFFPEKGKLFNMECDDGFFFKCIRAQANGKALETPEDNSILGLYFRKRLGVRPGYMVTTDHLYRYGRTSVDIYFRGNDKYYLDFSILSKETN